MGRGFVFRNDIGIVPGVFRAKNRKLGSARSENEKVTSRLEKNQKLSLDLCKNHANRVFFRKRNETDKK